MADPTPKDTPPPLSQPTPNPTPTQGVEHPVFHRSPLVISLIVAVLLVAAVLVVTSVLNGRAGLSSTDWKALTAPGKLAASLVVPLTVLGIVLVALGAAMAFTEWLGTFATTDTDGVKVKGLSDVSTVIDSVGKLRGPALVLVTGALLLGASAWVASSAAAPPPPAASSGSTTQG